MKQDDFLKKLRSELDGLAQHHKDKPVVMTQVIEEIQHRETSRYGLWKMSGFALAAALTGFIIFPNAVDLADKPQNQVVVTPKLSPQMVEDLEMLMVLGEDKVSHGS
jgi:hypothetical protein